MKKVFATILLVVSSTLISAAGVWAAYGRTWYTVGKVDILPSLLFLVCLPSPMVFVWRSLRDRYDFGKTRFYLCTIVPQYITSLIAGIILFSMAADADGYGALGVLVYVVVYVAAKFGLVIAMVAWLAIGGCCERIKSDRVRKALAIILLTLCGVFVCGGWHGLLDYRFLDLISIIRYNNQTPPVVSYINGTLPKAATLAIPIGIGASALARAYREEYKLKAPLFMLLSFMPALIIAGVRLALIYLADKEYYFYRSGFTDMLETLILTAAVAIFSAIIYAVAALIRSRRHYY